MTKAWELYEAGKRYNNSLVPNQYTLVDTNTEFAVGNQWVHLPNTAATAKLDKPTFNIIKRVMSLFISSLTSSAVSLSFGELAFYDANDLLDPTINAATYATAEVQNLLEKFKFEYRVRDALNDGAVTGDYCAHMYFDSDALPYGGAFGGYRGEIKFELVDGINVMFGKPNSRDAQSQPYILIVGRDTVDNLRHEQERFREGKTEKHKVKMSEDEAFLHGKEYDGVIVPDREIMEQAGIGGQTELQADDDVGQALYVLMYSKKQCEEVLRDPETGLPRMEDVLDENGDPVYELDEQGLPILDMDGEPVVKQQECKRLETHVYVTKATRTAVIYEDIDTGLSLYPVAWGNWEKQKNQYHGRALVTGVIPNQIFINTMFALMMMHLKREAIPKAIYNADVLPVWNNDAGSAIGVYNMQPGQRLDEVATYLKPGDMSNQIMLCIDKAMQYTRDVLGATDAQMGKVRAENTSALMVLQSASEVPLENIRANLYEWVEDIGAILLDMMGTYYGKRPLVRSAEFTEIATDPNTGAPRIDPMSGQMITHKVVRRVAEEFDFRKFKHLYLNTRVDVGATTYFSEIAMVQTLDNLRREGLLDPIAYLQRLPDRYMPNKEELIEELRARMEAQAEAQEDAQRAAFMQGLAEDSGYTPPGGIQPSGGPGIPGSNSKHSVTAGVNNPNTVAGGKENKKDGNFRPIVNGPLDKERALTTLTPKQQAEYDTLPASAKRAMAKLATMKN